MCRLSGHHAGWQFSGGWEPGTAATPRGGSSRAGPGSQGPSHHPSQEQGRWGQPQPRASGTSVGTGLGGGWAGLWACRWGQDQAWLQHGCCTLSMWTLHPSSQTPRSMGCAQGPVKWLEESHEIRQVKGRHCPSRKSEKW